MARPVSRRSALVRQFDDWDAAVCLLDVTRRIVFCNSRFAECFGCAVDDLIGRICEYHSETKNAERTIDDWLNGVCPPADAFEQSISEGMVRLPGRPPGSGESATHAATYVRLEAGGETSGVLVIVQSEVCGAPDAKRQDRSQALHQQIWRLRDELRSEFQSGDLIGATNAMSRVRRQIELAAQSRCTITIVGSSGCGKEHVARTIYALAEQSPLMPIACRLIDADALRRSIDTLLAETSSSDTARPTLMLLNVDELGELAQDVLIDQLGDKRRVWPIATASENWADAGLRLELREALSELTIWVPSLRERRDDVPLLAQYFLERYNAGALGHLATAPEPIQGFTSSAMEQLVAYPWPGNVQELRDVVCEAAEHGDPPELGPDQLPMKIRHGLDAALNPIDEQPIVDLETRLAEVERSLIQQALEAHAGNKTQAAKALNISRARLLRRIEFLKL